MNSRSLYPTNTGSLGQPRRLISFATSVKHQVSTHFIEERTQTSAIEISAKPTVLIVEDDDDFLFVLKSVLKTKGYHVIEAGDGKLAVDVAETQNLDKFAGAPSRASSGLASKNNPRQLADSRSGLA